ncbi:MAG TPA: hypothetical protein VNT99_00630 [Methylomirabilota bacterium]|nr:hypothetical protein [Methylomirabilota bacterium]
MTVRPKTLLRFLIIANLALAIMIIVVDLVSASSLPEPLRAYRQAELESGITGRDLVLLKLAIPLLIVMLLSNIGLLVFWRPARPLYLVTLVAGSAWTPFAGPYVASGWSQSLQDTSLIVMGVVLALIYWSPLKDLYEKPKNVAEQDAA